MSVRRIQRYAEGTSSTSVFWSCSKNQNNSGERTSTNSAKPGELPEAPVDPPDRPLLLGPRARVGVRHPPLPRHQLAAEPSRPGGRDGGRRDPQPARLYCERIDAGDFAGVGELFEHGAPRGRRRERAGARRGGGRRFYARGTKLHDGLATHQAPRHEHGARHRRRARARDRRAPPTSCCSRWAPPRCSRSSPAATTTPSSATTGVALLRAPVLRGPRRRPEPAPRLRDQLTRRSARVDQLARLRARLLGQLAALRRRRRR